MTRRRFATLGAVLAVALLLSLPSVPRRAKQARIERSRVVSTSPAPGPFERKLLDAGCASVVLLPLEESLRRPLTSVHRPMWWAQCTGPVEWSTVAEQLVGLPGGVLIETDDGFAQVDASDQVVSVVPIMEPHNPHDRSTTGDKVRSFLRAYLGH